MMKYRVSLITAMLLPVLLGACSSINEMLSGDQVDYKSSSNTPKHNVLETPPDLSNLPKDEHFQVPDSKQTGSVTKSQFDTETARQGAQPAPGSTGVLPVADYAHIERAGGQRWLVVNRTPEQLWPVLSDFWQEQGFLLTVNSPQTGIMETNWAENQAKLPLDIIRRNIGTLLDSIYDTGTRDKYRTRLERRPDGSTEVYISHRGMVEVVTSQQNQTTMWTQRPSDPELEAEFLRRLLVRLGAPADRAKTIVAAGDAPATSSGPGNAGADTARSHLVSPPNGAPYVLVDDAFDRAWRRVGLALDRVNFTVEDRDRTQGTYFVRFVDPKVEGKDDRGVFAKIFESNDKSKLAVQYRVVVKGQADNATSQVTVQTKDGQPETGDAGQRILALLNDQLK